jgi:Fic family protein
MAQLKDREWVSRFASGAATRLHDAPGHYEAYVPDRLTGRPFSLETPVAADIADAERSITRLDAEARSLANMEGLARILLRAEAVASSRIEGLSVAPQRLLRVAAAHADGEKTTTDATAEEVLANVDAMTYALADPDSPITVERVLEVHRRLLAPTNMAMHAGVLRTEQNWIGGTSYNPFGAAFVPPPPEDVPDLLRDLCDFCNEDSLPAVAQAAIAHAQFETLHPFADGNGRTGRALIHMVFARRRLVTRTLVPVSLILATQANDYVAALTGTRYLGASDSVEAIRGINTWVALFAVSCSRAVADAESFERRTQQLQVEWRTRLGSVRSDATVLRLLDRLIATPVITVRRVAEDLGVSVPAANNAVAQLLEAEIVTQVRAGRRNRAFEAREIVDAFTSLERQLARPSGDTRTAEPNRTVPERPQRV